MKTVLDPALSFSELAELAEADGWEQVHIPGLKPPLRPGEPELARFERDGATIFAHFNPAIGLRVLEGAKISDAPSLNTAQIATMLADPNAEQALAGFLAADAAGLVALVPSMIARLEGLDGPAHAMARSATDRLAAHEEAARLPPDDLRRMLRAAIAQADKDMVRGLVPAALESTADIAACLAIGAARLGLREVAPALARRNRTTAALPKRERELCEAMRRVALMMLSGAEMDGGTAAAKRLWQAVRGGDAVNPETVAVASLVTPLPLPGPETLVGRNRFREVAAVCHWLGHETDDGLPSPLRRWTPPNGFRIAVLPVGQPVELEALAALEPGTRLPSAEEWEAALRGPDGRPHPWGRDRKPLAESPVSPWGHELDTRHRGEWATTEDGFVVCGTDPTGVVAIRHAPKEGARHLIRPVLI